MTDTDYIEVHIGPLAIAARVQDTAYFFTLNGAPDLGNSLERDILRAMLQHALDSLDGRAV